MKIEDLTTYTIKDVSLKEIESAKYYIEEHKLRYNKAVLYFEDEFKITIENLGENNQYYTERDVIDFLDISKIEYEGLYPSTEAEMLGRWLQYYIEYTGVSMEEAFLLILNFDFIRKFYPYKRLKLTVDSLVGNWKLSKDYNVTLEFMNAWLSVYGKLDVAEETDCPYEKFYLKVKNGNI